MTNVKPKNPCSPLDSAAEIRRVDKSSMLQFSINAPKHYREAARLAEKINVGFPKPDNVIIAGMGGFRQRQYFEMEDAARGPVHVQF